MDFLDANGNQLADASCSVALTNKTIGYIRQWQIQDANTFGTTPALKQITVAVYSMLAVNTNNAPDRDPVQLRVRPRLAETLGNHGPKKQFRKIASPR